MADFNFITDRVATGGGVNDEADVEALIAAGITHIIDCRGEVDEAPLMANHPALAYLYNGVADDGQSKPDEWFAKSIQFALPPLGQAGIKIYAHCAAGVNRGPSTAFAILLAQGFTAVDAEALMRKYRPQVNIAYKADAERAVVNLRYVSKV